MNRIIKWIAMVLAGFVLLLALASVLLPRFIDPNNYRDDISKLVHDQTGLTLKINGPIGWSIFPWLGLSIEQLSVAGTGNSKLAELDSAEVSVKLLPLLSKRIEIQTARLAGLNLELVRDKSGHGNWEVNQPEKVQTADSKSATETPQQTTDQGAPLQLDIASVEVTGLTVKYDNRQSGNMYVIDEASLETGAIANQTPFDINVNALVTSREPALNLKTHINATLTFNLKDGIYDLDNLTIAAQPNTANGENLSLKGNLHLQQEPLLVKGQLDVTQFNPRKLFTQLNIQLPPMAGEKALESLAFKSSFQSDGKSLDASKLDLTLDDFDINGFFKMTDLQKQAMTFKFKGNDLNLDNYLPPATESTDGVPAKAVTQDKQVAAKQPAPAAKEQPLIPEELLKSLNLNGSMSLTSLTASKLKFEQPSIKLVAANGQSQVSLESGFYQGTISMDGKIDVNTRGTPKINSSATLKGINLEAMAEPVPPLKSVQGTVHANMKINTQGQLQSVLTRNLNGTVSFGIDKGAFTEANFDKMVCEGIARIRNKKLQKTDWGKSTQFQDLSGTFIIRNGVATNKDLTAALSNLNLKGDGKVNLVEQTLDYHVGLNIRGEEAPDSDPACQVNKDYVDVTWPVRCQGKLGEQSCGIDTERLANTVAGLAKKEAQKRLQKEIDKKVEGPLKDVLKGFFK